MITKGFRIRIYPNSKQKLLINKHFGCYRFIWNYYLTKNAEYYKNTGKFLCDIDFCKNLTILRRDDNYSWLQEVSCVSLQQIIRNLDKALRRCSRKISRYPKFKKKKKLGRLSYPANSQNFYFKSEGVCVIEKLGKIKLKTDFKFNISRKFCNTFKNVWVLKEDNKYFITFDLELENQKEELNDYTIGIDLGLRNFATISYQDNFKFYSNYNKSKEMKKLERKIELMQRSISRKYRQNNSKQCFEKGGKFKKTNNIIKLEMQVRKLQRKVANKMTNNIYHIIKDILKLKPNRIVLEDLKILEMLQNKKLSKYIQKVNWGKFKYIISYKCNWQGIKVIFADTYYASSKTCSRCGYKIKDLTYRDIIFNCKNCNLKINRDLNAAINLANYGT